ncbi:FixH family protein [Peribacillus sp. SCS-155]|uniref:FixH family protein n=1 Tax=Peribacillus sedimenti TaxID=3115297 RepID=UPI003906A160
MKKYYILFISMFLLLAGCAQNDNSGSKQETPEFIEVSIKAPEKVKLNEVVTFEATVTQGKEKVDDADEVQFEFRKQGEAESEMVDAKNQGSGVYAIKKAFKDNGIYIVVAHVTARDMHNMPSTKITVGTPDTIAGQKHPESTEEAPEHEHHHGNAEVAIHFDIDEAVTSKKPVTLNAHIMHKDQPLTAARVRFEIWKQGEQKHAFLEAKEQAGAEYNLNHTFAAPGQYQVVVHVEKDEIHEHQEQTVTVK